VEGGETEAVADRVTNLAAKPVTCPSQIDPARVRGSKAKGERDGFSSSWTASTEMGARPRPTPSERYLGCGRGAVLRFAAHRGQDSSHHGTSGTPRRRARAGSSPNPTNRRCKSGKAKRPKSSRLRAFCFLVAGGANPPACQYHTSVSPSRRLSPTRAPGLQQSRSCGGDCWEAGNH
jgi:hypothetical protein